MNKKCLTALFLFLISARIFSATALVWNPGGMATTSATAIQTALTANSVTVTYSNLSTFTAFSGYTYVFICLGINSSKYVLSATTNATAITNLIAYLNGGGKVYMEGGDTWAWDFPTSLHNKFYIYGEADGAATGDLGQITASFCSTQMVSAYSGTQNYIDHLAPQEGAAVFFTNSSPAYACGIAYANSTYRTLGVSFQFGGWGDASSRTALMASILGFFETGCTFGKPAPLFARAFSGYDGAVPLLWDAPPGQSPLSVDATASPSPLVFSEKQQIGDVKSRSDRPGRKLEDRAKNASAQMQIHTYQVTSYNVYRSSSRSGTYTLLASSIDKQYYRDETATNGDSAFYKIKAVYDGIEGDFSAVAAALPAAGGYSQTSPYKFINPVINGQIQTDEWTNAAAIAIGASATLYLFNDDDYLYLAVDDVGNSSLDVGDQIGFYFDKNNDLRWGTGSLTEEGNFWIWQGVLDDSVKFRGLKGWWPYELEWGTNQPAVGLQYDISAGSGKVQYEARIDLANSALNISTGSSFGLYVYSFAMTASSYTGAWPNVVSSSSRSDAWMIPALYGSVQLTAPPAAPYITDAEAVTATVPATYQFNEFGNGREVTLDFTTVGVPGTLTVTQTNTNPQQPRVNDQFIPCVWSLTPSNGLDNVVVNSTFYYLDTDLTGINETHLQVFRWSGSEWNLVGGTVNDYLNSVEVQLDHFSDYALFEYTPITLFLTSFTAEEKNGGVLLQWQTKAEVDHAGFNVFRSDAADSGFVRINSEMIPVRAEQPTQGNDYRFVDAAPHNGINYYKLQDISLSGQVTFSTPISATVTTAVSGRAAAPESFELMQNYPNPFNPETRIEYQLPREEFVELGIYNLGGQLISSLVSEYKSLGFYTIVWDGRDDSRQIVGSGVYILRIKAGDFVMNKRITLLR